MDKKPRSFEEIARQAVNAFISETDDSVMDSEVRAAIMQEACRLVQHDDEVRAKIRERLIYWIGRQ
jgi:hypothetical protein